MGAELGETLIRIVLGLAIALAAGILARELQKSVEAERSARARLDRAERAKSQLIRLISHDLRNPLSVITSYAHLLSKQRSRFDEEQFSKALEQIERSAQRLDDRLEDLLEIDSVFGGQREAQPQRVSIPALLEAALSPLQVENHRLQVDAADEVVVVDIRTIRHLIRLTVSSAIRHIARDRTIVVRSQIAGDRLLVQVSPSWFPSGGGDQRAGLGLVEMLAEDYGGGLRPTQAGGERAVELSIPCYDMPKGHV
ncbi:MAG TPA: histidine kinase dimerization/phospho-acceptor domain-containing protein [Actinomycetota bacterium]|nr:histidine kinase dimerization/phospho-acceptor domain-containing protein [Actinomycetota bacterium]